MKNKRPDPDDEVHEIRHQLMEETKSLSDEEFCRYLHESTKEVAKRLGLKRLSPELVRR